MTEPTPILRRRTGILAALAMGAALAALTVTAPAAAAEHDLSNTTPVAIPDGTTSACWSLPPANPAVSTIEVPSSGVIDDITVTVDLRHTWRGDLLVELESP